MASSTSNRPAIIVMGVCGCGKSSFAQALAADLGLVMVDGDDLHPKGSIAKMKRGQPLTDDDRWPWLDNVAATLGDLQRAPLGIVIACSALKRVYRDRIRAGASEPRFVFLDASYDLVASRMKERQGHFMPQSLVDSQFRTLERPTASESDVLNVPASLPVDAAMKMTISKLALCKRS
jgi:gluconokinase